jgi:ribosomal protein S27E
VDACDPDGREIHPSFTLNCGAELRPVRTKLDATLPVLEFHVGGTAKPTVTGVRDKSSGFRFNVADQTWDEEARFLRVRLDALQVGPISDLQVRVRWPNGFEQDRPALKRFYAEPRVELDESVAVAGCPSTIKISADPQPIGARVGGTAAALERGALSFTASHPGVHRVELEYRTRTGETTWREVGVVSVSSAATISCPDMVNAGESVTVAVTDVDRQLAGQHCVLRVGSTVVGEWVGSDAFTWTGGPDEDESIEVTVELKSTRTILARRFIDVALGLTLNYRTSVPIATADGKHIAELAWRGLEDGARSAVAASLVSEGFEVDGWNGDVLRVRGNPSTIGKRLVTVGSRSVAIWTLNDLELSLNVDNVRVGGLTIVETAKGELLHGLNEIDGGPLELVVDRIEPVYDSLSCTVRGNQITFLHGGTYSVALVFGMRRLAEISVEAKAPTSPPLHPGAESFDRTFGRLTDASQEASTLPANLTTSVLGQVDGGFRVLHGDPRERLEEVSNFIFGQRKKGTKVVVTWPGLRLEAATGELLARVRTRRPNDLVGFLPYPAPRGELVDSPAEARQLRKHRVLCSAKRNSLIDRGDELQCSHCKSRQVLQTNARAMWLLCQVCSRTDKSVVLTLLELRNSDVDVLFADYRMARYLRSATGVKYAGAFARTVRCSACHGLQLAYSHPSPWNTMELQALTGALGSSWDASDPDGTVRRAARLVARRDFRADLSAARRLEDLAQRLVDVGVVVNGETMPTVRRLEHGVSLCCGAKLTWSRRRSAHVFLNVEELKQPLRDPSLHPELSFGEHAIRQFLGLHS